MKDGSQWFGGSLGSKVGYLASNLVGIPMIPSPRQQIPQPRQICRRKVYLRTLSIGAFDLECECNSKHTHNAQNE